jgi:predicted transcriptional regulator
MQTVGKELKAILDELDEVTPARAAAEAGVSIATLYNVFNDEPVRTKSLSRVRKALTKLKLKSKTG